MAAANPRTVVAVVAGSAVVVSEWDHLVPALVQSWYSGMEGGHGLADVLTGRVDATGRLPFSVPVSPDDLPAFDPDATEFTYDAWHGYWYLARQRHGAGLPVRLRPQLHLVRPPDRRGRKRREDDPDRGVRWPTPAPERGRTSSRCTPTARAPTIRSG